MWWHRTQHNCASDTVSLKGVRGQKVDLLRFPVKKYSPQRTPQSRVATTDITSKSMRGAGTNMTVRLELVCVQGVGLKGAIDPMVLAGAARNSGLSFGSPPMKDACTAVSTNQTSRETEDGVVTSREFSNQTSGFSYSLVQEWPLSFPAATCPNRCLSVLKGLI